jgi:hypothetical protein
MMFQPVSDAPFLNHPANVDQVVELLFNDISLRDKVVMAGLSENEFDSSVYLAMAKILRKEFGLYSSNSELLESCSSYLGTTYDTYEDPAMVIIKELWKKVKQNHNLHLIEKRLKN